MCQVAESSSGRKRLEAFHIRRQPHVTLTIMSRWQRPIVTSRVEILGREDVWRIREWTAEETHPARPRRIDHMGRGASCAEELINLRRPSSMREGANLCHNVVLRGKHFELMDTSCEPRDGESSCNLSFSYPLSPLVPSQP